MTPEFLIIEPPSGRAASLLRTVADLTGHSVRTVGRADAALVALRSGPPDLVVFDAAAAGGDPLREVRALRRASTSQLIVLAERAKDLKRLRAHAAELSVAAVLIRSTSAAALQSFVRRLLLAPRPVTPLPERRSRLCEVLLRRRRRSAEPGETVTLPQPQPQPG